MKSIMSIFLDKIGKWMYVNSLTLNGDKATFMTFECYKDSVPEYFELTIYNKKIHRINNCKYLGFAFDGLLR